MSRKRRLAAILAIGFSTCSEDPRFIGEGDAEICGLMRRDGAEYCIDTYEEARADATETSAGLDDDSAPQSHEALLPWTEVSWAAALTACERKDKRLCDRDEWIDACDGAVGEDAGNRFTYGNELNSGICNTDEGGPVATGTRAGCVSTVGAFDLSGNVREWTGNTRSSASTRGGAWPSSQTHDCKSGDTMSFIEPEGASVEVGFRCCRTL